ncbi:hypothetical protein H5S09_09745 [Limosilactobacillus sp. STM2_1]|uniref:Core-binding (CB) domain-containing protein n=1 Tax=Limosilactobacillus rudii TaxID=2759755 RepID=A0A7W3UMB1_9LACO|nr:hypothetical protein [Limosilactobacillus rudii]MBB1078908.1 hypothetical protein [Limosilactobacillus rudii]MBB1098216.1 hypothetical protein [Limosilactobacillus rudii]MCD7135669.1 hypothetical protein [Limosilactobacillus rudii]
MYINVAGKAKNLFNNYQQAENDTTTAIAQANPLFSWHVTYFTVQHKKYLVFLNDATTMAVILYDVNAKNKQHIKERFEATLKAVWTGLGLSIDAFNKYLAASNEWQINKTIDRSQMGSLVLLCRDYAKPLADTMDEVGLSQRLTTIMKRHGNGYINESDTLTIITNAQPFKVQYAKTPMQPDNHDELEHIIDQLDKLSSTNYDFASSKQIDQATSKIQTLNNQLLDIFLNDIRGEYSSKTIKSYEGNLKFYLNEWLAYNLQAFFDFNSADVEELLYHGSSRNEIKNIERALKRLMHYLHDKGVIDDDDHDEYIALIDQGDSINNSDDSYFSDDFVDGDDLTFNTINTDLPTIFDGRTDQLIDDYFASFASMYGVISVRHAFQIIKAQNPQLNLSEQKFKQYVQDRIGEQELRYYLLDLNQMADDLNLDETFEKGIFIAYSALLTDCRRLIKLYNHQLGLQYYVPEKAEIMRYKYDDYFDLFDLREQLDKLFMTRYQLTGSNLQGAVFICIYGMKLGLYQDLDLVSMAETINRIIKMLNDTINLNITPDKSSDELIKLLLLIAANIRRPWNRGWTSAEINSIPDVAAMFNANYPALSAETIEAVKQGQIDRQELIYYIEDSDLPIAKINSLRKQIKEI